MKKAITTVLTVLGILLMAGVLAYLAINIFMPNTASAMSAAIEDSIYRVSNFKVDLDGDGVYGSADRDQYGGGSEDNASEILDQNKVEGFSK